MESQNNLPPYLYCDDSECTERHFLTLNTDVQGMWGASYVEFGGYTTIEGLWFSEASSMYEALARMRAALTRRKLRRTRSGHGDGSNEGLAER